MLMETIMKEGSDILQQKRECQMSEHTHTHTHFKKTAKQKECNTSNCQQQNGKM